MRLGMDRAPRRWRGRSLRDPRVRPEEAGLERLRLDRGSMLYETPETPLGQGRGGIVAARIEMASALG